MVQITEKLKRLSIFVGIDVHKEKWVISIYEGKEFTRSFSMSADIDQLIKHLELKYGQHLIRCVYEAGFSGFWMQKRLVAAGINCIIVNAADIPTTDYERRRKTDKLDAKKLAKHLAWGNLEGIYIPSEEQLQIRSLVRARLTIAKEKRKTMCRIRAFINFHGIDLPKELQPRLWTKRGLEWLKEKTQEYLGLEHHLELYTTFRAQELKAARQIRKYLKDSSLYSKLYEVLLSIPGIGWTSASLLIAELGTMDRFQHLDQLASFCGLVPDVRSSADKHKVLGISKRANKRLRSTLVESAWISIRHDPAMQEAYSKPVGEGKIKQKVIIKIARKLLSRMRAIWMSLEEYQVNKT